MNNQAPFDLFDERLAAVRLLDEVLHRRPEPLTGHGASRAPGVYLLFGFPPIGAHKVDPYGPLRDRPLCWPIYAGSAAVNLADRLRRHVKKATHVDGLLDELFVVALPCTSAAVSLWAERVLLEAFRPAWGEPWCSGWGSKPCGTNRLSQRPNAWSVLTEPTRRYHRRPRHDAEQLARMLVEHLERTVPPGGAWPQM